MGELRQEYNLNNVKAFQLRRNGYLRCIFFVCLMMISLRVAAPGVSVAFILASEHVSAYDKLIDAIVMVESAGDNFAINVEEEAYGAFQIRPIRLLDYNQRTGKNYSIVDCFSYEISKEIFLYYAGLISYSDYETIARNWNGSGRMTLDYWGKVKKYL